MKRLALGLLTLLLVVAAAAFSGDKAPTGILQVAQEERNPWSNLKLNNDPDEFRFAFVSDRTGGHREKVFSRAVEKLNLLQPEFVVSVGDLIEGGKGPTAEKLATQWKEFQGFVDRLQMPFFYLPGNHDMGSEVSKQVWQEKFGRTYYHFVYRNVLFLMLNSEDPPGSSGFAPEQIAWAQRVLGENKGVRWTILVMHKPLWVGNGVAKTGLPEIEKALADRPYTVFCGHKHIYQRFVRNQRIYYQLATTGGSSKMRGVPYGEFDHVVMVTMKKTGPMLANVLIDGVFPDDMKEIDTKEPGVVRPLLIPQPTQGKITFDGKPVSDVRVVLHPLDAKAGGAVRPEALTAGNGTFIFTTYARNDGAPAGEYAVTVVRVPPMGDEKLADSALPERYGKPETTDLRAKIQEGLNQVILDLKK